MSLNWRIQNFIEARDLLRKVGQNVAIDSDVDKACRSAMLTIELAWIILERETEGSDG